MLRILRACRVPGLAIPIVAAALLTSLPFVPVLPVVPVADTLAAQTPSGDGSSIVVVAPRGSDLRALDAQARAAGFARTGAIPRSATGAAWLIHAAARSREQIGQASLTRQLAEQAGADHAAG